MSSGALLMGFKVWLDHWIWAGRGSRVRCHISENGWKTIVRGRGCLLSGCSAVMPGCGCGWLSIAKVYEVWLIIARLCCRCPRALSPLSSSLGTLQLSSDSVDGNYCLRNYFTDQTHFPSERNFNISNYRGSRFLTPQRRQSKVYLQVWSLIRPELRQYL